MIKTSSDILQPLLDSVQEEVSYTKWPGKLPLGGHIREKVEPFFDEAFSIESDSNQMRVFSRITTARRVLDSLPSVNQAWYIDYKPLDGDWDDPIDRLLATPKTFATTVVVSLRFKSMSTTLVEYKGSMRIGGNYHPSQEDFGISLDLNMKLITKVNPEYIDRPKDKIDRFSDLDLEYSKREVNPIKALFKPLKDTPIFTSTQDTIPEDMLENIVLLADNGKALDLSSLEGDRTKIQRFVEKNSLSSKVTLEGLVIWDNKGSRKQPRVLDNLREECDSVQPNDPYLSVECMMTNTLSNPDGSMKMVQSARISLRKLKRNYCGTIIELSPMRVVDAPVRALERIEKDFSILADIQSQFNDSIKRSIFIPNNAKDLDLRVQSFLRDIPNLLPKSKVEYSMILDGYSKDVLTTPLEDNPSWKQFKGEYEIGYSYDFTLDLHVSMFDGKKMVPIVDYKGTFVVDVEERIKLMVDLEAKKTSYTGRDYSPKKVNRFSDLEY